MPLANALREHTRALHAQAERSGVMQALLHGVAGRPAYTLLLRNLLPAYLELEHALERLRELPALRSLAQRAVYRAASLESDLVALCGEAWRHLPVLADARRYADRIAGAAQGNAVGIVAHAYVRYLGDLNGGRLLRAVLGRTLRLPPEALSFYAFPGVDDLGRLRDEYRAAFDRLQLTADERQTVLDEAAEAFRLNIGLSTAVERAQAENPSPGA